MQITITRRSRNLGYGVTSHVRRDGRGIETPRRQTIGLTPRTLLRLRPGEVRSVGGNPNGGDGCWYAEGIWVGRRRVKGRASDLLWDLQSLAWGHVDQITVTVEVS